MKFNEVLKDIDLIFSKHKDEHFDLTYCIDHTKTLASLDYIEIVQYKGGGFTVWVHDPLGTLESQDSIVYKDYKTLEGAKQFITKVVQDEQQRHYQDLIFCKQV